MPGLRAPLLVEPRSREASLCDILSPLSAISCSCQMETARKLLSPIESEEREESLQASAETAALRFRQTPLLQLIVTHLGTNPPSNCENVRPKGCSGSNRGIVKYRAFYNVSSHRKRVAKERVVSRRARLSFAGATRPSRPQSRLKPSRQHTQSAP
jgi:hypothetical protein